MNNHKNTKIPLYTYTDREWNKLSSFIKTRYGEFDDVIHEYVSPDIHLDIAVVPPSDEQPYFKLVTFGAGAFKMNVPEDCKPKLERAEYVIFLPKDWDVDSNEERYYWPIRMLKIVARLPISTDSWLAYGHTVQMNEDASPFSESAGFNSCILMPSFGKDDCIVTPLKLGLFGKEVNFYQVYPLYKEELEFKLKHSFKELLEKIKQDRLDLVINTQRKNYCE